MIVMVIFTTVMCVIDIIDDRPIFAAIMFACSLLNLSTLKNYLDNE